MPVVDKFSFPKLIAPPESVIEPFASVRLPTVEPVAKVATPAPNVPVVDKFSFPKLIAPLESVIDPLSNVKVLAPLEPANEILGFILIVLPLLVKFVPAEIEPAPLNWVNSKSWVSTTALPLFDVHTKPWSLFVVPSSTKVKSLEALSPVVISSDLVHDPDLQRYIPFCDFVVWSLTKTLLSAITDTPSIVWVPDKVILPVVATLTAPRTFNPSATLSTYALFATWVEFDGAPLTLIEVHPVIVPLEPVKFKFVFVNTAVILYKIKVYIL